MRKIGILTGGGDCPGLNAVIRGVVEKCAEAGMEVFGFRDGWRGALNAKGHWLTLSEVEGIQTLGGTIIGSSRTNVLAQPDGTSTIINVLDALGLEGLVAIGGDYQGIPIGGYTQLVEHLLEGIEVRLNTDYLEQKEKLDRLAETVVYTGPIDAYFGYSLGALEYRSVRFETEVLDIPNFQGNAAVNYTDRETPWTRIIEHKWFEFGKDEQGQDLPKTVISREYSSEWKPGDEPYYPVNDEKNGALYAEYKRLADTEKNVIFGGRLAEYRYYDMDAVIASALKKSEEVL